MCAFGLYRSNSLGENEGRAAIQTRAIARIRSQRLFFRAGVTQWRRSQTRLAWATFAALPGLSSCCFANDKKDRGPSLNHMTFSFKGSCLTPALSCWERENHPPMVLQDDDNSNPWFQCILEKKGGFS